MRCLIPLLLAVAGAAGEVPAPIPPAQAQLPKAAQAISDQLAADLRKSYLAYRAAAEKAQEAAAAKLQQELERETKKGNLDGALRIREEIAAVKEGRPLAAVERAERADVLGNVAAPEAAPAFAAFAGLWLVTYSTGQTRTLRIAAAGKVEVVESTWGGAGTSFQLERRPEKPELAVGTTISEILPGDHLESFRIIGERLIVDHWWPAGGFPAKTPTTSASGARVREKPAAAGR